MNKVAMFKEFCKKNKKEIVGYTLTGLIGCIIGGVCVSAALRSNGEEASLLKELKGFGPDGHGTSMVQYLLTAQKDCSAAHVLSADGFGVPIANISEALQEYAEREGIDFGDFYVKGAALFGNRA